MGHAWDSLTGATASVSGEDCVSIIGYPAQRFSQGLGPAPLYTAPTAPSSETGDKRYTWLNKVQAVATGTLFDRTR